MGTLYENITSLCSEKGIKGGKMCVDLGISKSLMTKLRDNPARQITSETAKKSPITSAYRWSGSSPGKKKTPPVRRPRA